MSTKTLRLSRFTVASGAGKVKQVLHVGVWIEMCLTQPILLLPKKIIYLLSYRKEAYSYIFNI
jgi:hypothetical protein